MTEIVTLTLDELGVRQNYEPETPVGRHWLLDFAPGRDFLMSALVKEQPSLKNRLWKAAPELDAELTRMIDLHGLRDLVAPNGPMEVCSVTGKLLKMMVRLYLPGRGTSVGGD